MSGDLDVLCFGEALVDFFPPRPGLPLSQVERFARHVGGAPANVAIGMARAGVRVGMQTLVGPDAFGEFVLDALAAEGIDTAAVGRHPSAKTGVAFVSLAGDGSRSFLFFRHPSADMAIAPAQVTEQTLARARVLHLGSSTLSRQPSRDATLRAVELAHARGMLVSIDPNLRPHLWDDLDEARALLRPILARASVVKISDDELAPLLDVRVGHDVFAAAEEGARRLRALGAGLVLVTLGDRGALWEGPSGRGRVPATRVDAVDATGAGDAFVAGFWAELVAELRDGRAPATLPSGRIEAAVRRGCALGAAAVTALGATTAVLPREALRPIAGTPPNAWTFLDEKVVLETRIFAIQSRRLVSPRTGETRDFSLIRCPDWCNIVALTDAGEVVMVRQVRHGVGEVTLELPGGMVDPEDASPLEACQRELLEETGYAGVGGRIVGVIEPNPAMQTNRCHTAIVRGARKVAEQTQDAGEDLEVVLVPYGEIPARIARGEITHALVVVAFAWALGLQSP